MVFQFLKKWRSVVIKRKRIVGLREPVELAAWPRSRVVEALGDGRGDARGTGGKAEEAAPAMSDSEEAATTPAHASESAHYAWSKRSATDPATLAALEAKRAPQRAPAAACATAGRKLARKNSDSPWNRGGRTWEERDITEMARTALDESLRAFVHENAGYRVSVRSVSTGSGSASVVFVRGKVRVGFELSDVSVTLALCDGEDGASPGAAKAEDDGAERVGCVDSDDEDAAPSCVVKIAELNDDEVGEWSAKVVPSNATPAATSFVRKEVVPALFRAVVAWRDHLAAACS